MAKEANLVIFCWGDENADKSVIKYLKELGLHGIIYDKFDQYTLKETKESIFLMEARESEKELLRNAAANAEMLKEEIVTATAERMVDIGRARFNLDTISTATSLESLESRVSGNAGGSGSDN